MKTGGGKKILSVCVSNLCPEFATCVLLRICVLRLNGGCPLVSWSHVVNHVAFDVGDVCISRHADQGKARWLLAR